MDRNLLAYVPKEYRKYVADIYRTGEKEWNEITNRWNYPVTILWQPPEGEQFESTYSNAQHITEVLDCCGVDFYIPDQTLTTL